MRVGEPPARPRDAWSVGTGGEGVLQGEDEENEDRYSKGVWGRAPPAIVVDGTVPPIPPAPICPPMLLGAPHKFPPPLNPPPRPPLALFMLFMLELLLFILDVLLLFPLAATDDNDTVRFNVGREADEDDDSMVTAVRPPGVANDNDNNT